MSLAVVFSCAWKGRKSKVHMNKKRQYSLLEHFGIWTHAVRKPLGNEDLQASAFVHSSKVVWTWEHVLAHCPGGLGLYLGFELLPLIEYLSRSYSLLSFSDVLMTTLIEEVAVGDRRGLIEP